MAPTGQRQCQPIEYAFHLEALKMNAILQLWNNRLPGGELPPSLPSRSGSTSGGSSGRASPYSETVPSPQYSDDSGYTSKYEESLNYQESLLLKAEDPYRVQESEAQPTPQPIGVEFPVTWKLNQPIKSELPVKWNPYEYEPKERRTRITSDSSTSASDIISKNAKSESKYLEKDPKPTNPTQKSSNRGRKKKASSPGHKQKLRDSANSRERLRVQRIRCAFDVLQKNLPDYLKQPRMKHVDILWATIEYMKELDYILQVSGGHYY